MLLLRKVEEKDIKLLFDWANDPHTRANSLNSEEIVWDEHKSWFLGKLSNPEDNKLYLVEDAGVEVGLIRFEKRDLWKVGIVISSGFRGKGFGAKCLELGVLEFRKESRGPIYAEIKRENVGSIKIFEKNNFKLKEEREVLLYKRD
jgi:RimJ/RimL family protein N-acetyltransferase